MKSKALLVGAPGSFEGPRVSLESGVWLVEPHPFVEVVVADSGEILNGDGRLDGPAVVFAKVRDDYEGDGVFLQARQIKR